ANEFGFDFLRDRLLLRSISEGATDFLGAMLGRAVNLGGEQPVQRSNYFALVDEADSILIDEARTPLIISALPGDAEKIAVAAYQWSAKSAPSFEDEEHYTYDHVKKTVELTTEGRRLMRAIPKPELLDNMGLVTLYEYIERAIKADRAFTLDQQ